MRGCAVKEACVSELWRHPVSQQRDAVASNHRQVVDPPQSHAREEGGDAVVLQLARHLNAVRSFMVEYVFIARLCFSARHPVRRARVRRRLGGHPTVIINNQ